ncbi:MAG: NUDIX hydrolase [Candidatus Diapherotrites archaeon]|nr:NUDIX hydrolase [Candidatus Diapherotrites archaeon]
MKTKYGVTGIVFDKIDSKHYFLLLHRKLNWSGWEFVKGGVEPGEEPKDAVLREVEEETGLQDAEIVKKVAGPLQWLAAGTKYIYSVFLVKADKNEPVALAADIVEHDGFEWVEEEKIEGMLTHEDNKIIFKKALRWLKKNA